MAEQLPEYRIVLGGDYHMDTEAELNKLAGQGYEVVFVVPRAESEGWEKYLLRLRAAADLAEQDSAATQAQAEIPALAERLATLAARIERAAEVDKQIRLVSRVASLEMLQADIMESLHIQRNGGNDLRADLTSLAAAVKGQGEMAASRLATLEARLDTLLVDFSRPGTDHGLQLRHIKAHDEYRVALDNLTARLDGLQPQLAERDKALLDRIEALEAQVSRGTVAPVPQVTHSTTCPKCNGRGRLGDRTWGAYGDEITSEHICTACDGTGKVPA